MTISASFLWVVAIVIFLVVEAVVPGLVSLWFAVGSLAALIAALLNAPLWLQAVWFFVISVLALVCTRPLAQKYINARVKPTNADMAIGQECIVTEEVDNTKGKGAAIVAGKTWTARSDDGTVFAEGDHAVVLRIEGVKVILGRVNR